MLRVTPWIGFEIDSLPNEHPPKLPVRPHLAEQSCRASAKDGRRLIDIATSLAQRAGSVFCKAPKSFALGQKETSPVAAPPESQRRQGRCASQSEHACRKA